MHCRVARGDRIDCSGEPPGGPSDADRSASADRRAPPAARSRRCRVAQGMARRGGSANSPARFCASARTSAMKSSSVIPGWSIWCFRKRLPPRCSPAMWPACSRPPEPRCLRAEGSAFRVLVASSNGELCRTIAEACAAAGYRVEQADDQIVGARIASRNEPAPAGETLLTIWDVPVLEAWTDRLERHALQYGPGRRLDGFRRPDTVALARSKGALACLELPLNLDDLIDVIDRFARSTARRDARPRPAGPNPPISSPRDRAAAPRTGRPPRRDIPVASPRAARLQLHDEIGI